MIAKGETSDAFYFYTLGSYPPENTECKFDESGSFYVTWDSPSVPSLGSTDNSTTGYVYSLHRGECKFKFSKQPQLIY